MRIIVLSDSHGDYFRVCDLFDRYAARADAVIHLGDGLREYYAAADCFPGPAYLAVRGNCDFPSDAGDAPDFDCRHLGGYRIFFTHGHLFSVKGGTSELWRAGREREADILLYGHTHTARIEYRDGVYLINPGAVSHCHTTPPGFLMLDLTEKGIMPNRIEL